MFIRISQGRLEAESFHARPKKKYSFTASKAGAKAMGKLLHRLCVSDVSYSSSVDFAQDNGGPDLDFRKMIEDAYEADQKIKGDKIKEQFLDYYQAAGRLTARAMVRKLLDRLGGDDVREVLEEIKKARRE